MSFLEEENKEDIHQRQVLHKFDIIQVAATQSFNMKESKRDWLFRVQVIYETTTFL